MYVSFHTLGHFHNDVDAACIAIDDEATPEATLRYVANVVNAYPSAKRLFAHPHHRITFDGDNVYIGHDTVDPFNDDDAIDAIRRLNAAIDELLEARDNGTHDEYAAARMKWSIDDGGDEMFDNLATSQTTLLLAIELAIDDEQMEA